MRGQVGGSRTRSRVDVGEDAGLAIGEVDGRPSFSMDDMARKPDLWIGALNAANEAVDNHGPRTYGPPNTSSNRTVETTATFLRHRLKWR